MTVEFAILLGAFGLGMLWLGRVHRDRHPKMEGAGATATLPGWVRRLSRNGEGPVQAFGLTVEIYGAGLLILASAVAFTGATASPIVWSLSVWFLGGIVVIGIVDAFTSLRGWRRRERGSRS